MMTKPASSATSRAAGASSGVLGSELSGNKLSMQIGQGMKHKWGDYSQEGGRGGFSVLFDTPITHTLFEISLDEKSLDLD